MKYQVPDLSGLSSECNITIQVDEDFDHAFSAEVPISVYLNFEIIKKPDILRAYFLLKSLHNLILYRLKDFKVATDLFKCSEAKFLSQLKDLKEMNLINVDRKFEGEDSLDEVYYIKFKD